MRKSGKMIRLAAAMVCAGFFLAGCHAGTGEIGAKEPAISPAEETAVPDEDEDQERRESDNAENPKEISGSGGLGQTGIMKPTDAEIIAEESSGQPDGETSEVPTVLKNLDTDGSLFSQTLYQAGNANCRMYCYVYRDENGDEFRSNRLGIMVTAGIPHYSDMAEAGELVIYADAQVETVPGQNTYETEMEVRGHQDQERAFEGIFHVTVSLTGSSGEEKAVVLQFLDKDSEKENDIPKEIRGLAGTYYDMGPDEDLFLRYLCKAEICAYPTELLRLMRNTVYAAHGRMFKDPLLSEYMERKPWYRKRVPAEEFSEDVLTDVEKKNIALLKEMEEIPADRRSMMYGADYSIENFAFAPYLPFLSQNGQIGLWADFTQAKDCGAYYSVPGNLSVPVTMTRKQWEHVQAGGKEELCVNELTGETRILEQDEEGNCYLHEKGARPDDGWSSDVQVIYRYDRGLYELVEGSDDTIMKLVYEGDLYFLKGAVYGGMVNLTAASALQEEITPQVQSVGGNPYHNGRGYFTAVYALGD